MIENSKPYNFQVLWLTGQQCTLQMSFKYFAPSWDIQQDGKTDSAFVFWPLILISCLVSINLFTIGAKWLCIDRWIWMVGWKCRRVVWCSCLSVPQHAELSLSPVNKQRDNVVGQTVLATGPAAPVIHRASPLQRAPLSSQDLSVLQR